MRWVASVGLCGVAFAAACTGAVSGDATVPADPNAPGSPQQPPAPPLGKSANADCGRYVEDYSFDVLYAEWAPWNVPVCKLERWSESDEYVERFWVYSHNFEGDASMEDPNRANRLLDFGLDPATDYTPPVYDVKDATTMKFVRRRAEWPGTMNVGINDPIPFNPSWKPARGSDGVLVILDYETGREWNFWGLVGEPNGFNDNQCFLAEGGYQSGVHLCAASANLIRSPDGEVADFRTYGGNFPARGVRIQFHAMNTLPEEVFAGEIRHALAMGAPNTMFGPRCTKEEQGTAAAGSTCGFALAPAGGLEWASGQCPLCGNALTPQQYRERTIPEGIRFALDLSDAEIEAWLDEREYTGRKRETARIFAVALREYGWFITDTGGVSGWNVAGAANPITAQGWRDLGIDDNGKRLLFGLLRKDRIWVVEPPINQCEDGSKSAYSCRAGASRYE